VIAIAARKDRWRDGGGHGELSVIGDKICKEGKLCEELKID
jgi:hypothetical protein